MPICMECNYKFKFAESRKLEFEVMKTMTEIQIAWLELMTVGGLGVIGFTRSYFQYHCKKTESIVYKTKQTDGIVKQYVSGKWKGVSNRGVLCEWNLL